MYFVFVIKTDASLCPVAIVKLYRKNCQNYFCVTTSPFAKMWLDEMLRKKGIKILINVRNI